MMNWERAGMEVKDVMHVGQSQAVGRMSGDVAAFSECKVIHS